MFLCHSIRSWEKRVMKKNGKNLRIVYGWTFLRSRKIERRELKGNTTNIYIEEFWDQFMAFRDWGKVEVFFHRINKSFKYWFDALQVFFSRDSLKRKMSLRHKKKCHKICISLTSHTRLVHYVRCYKDVSNFFYYFLKIL